MLDLRSEHDDHCENPSEVSEPLPVRKVEIPNPPTDFFEGLSHEEELVTSDCGFQVFDDYTAKPGQKTQRGTTL